MPAQPSAGRPLLLQLHDVGVRYGRIAALTGLSLEVAPGAIVALLGANGAGQSPTLRAISGLVPLASGSLTFDGRPLEAAAYRRPRLGIAHVPEGRRVFADQPVEDNLR